MKPPTKDQTDIGLDNPTLDASSGVELEYGDVVIVSRDLTRQEDKEAADIHNMLAKMGVVAPRGAPRYGEWDDSIDLMTAINSVQEARDAFANVPEELRKKFTSMEQLLDAVENGSLVLKDEEAPAPVKTELELLREEVAALKAAPSIAS